MCEETHDPLKCQNWGVSSVSHFINSEIEFRGPKRLASTQGGHQHPSLCNPMRKARLLSHQLPSTASTEVKKEPSILISCHHWNKAAEQVSILLHLLNKEGFCKGNRTASTYKIRSLEEAELIRSAFTQQSTNNYTITAVQHLLVFAPCQVLPETGHQGLKEMPPACNTSFQSYPSTDRSKWSKTKTSHPFTYLNDYATTAGPTKGCRQWGVLQESRSVEAWFPVTSAGQLCPWRCLNRQ